MLLSSVRPLLLTAVLLPFAVAAPAASTAAPAAAPTATPAGPETPVNSNAAEPAFCTKNTQKFCPVFEENFDRLDTKVWKHDVTMSGGGNWEFEWYTNNRTNSYTKDGSLYLHPTLTADNIGAANVVNGYTHNIEGNEALVHCTDPGFFGCVRTSDGRNIINPIQSARISTVNSFSMKYGRIEVRAKLPVGDWLWPAIWMLPTDSSYGNWPASGEIDIMESRGNAPGGQQVGADTYGSTLHWGPSFGYNGYPKTHKEYKLPGGKTFADDFHTFGMEWTPEGIKTYVDDPANVVLDVPFTQTFWDKGGFPTSMKNPWEGACTSAPFDQEFHLVMNVAVGGTASYFPDTPNKPWKNTSPNAALDFWNARDQWLPTWKGDNVAMKIDSVKAWKLC